MSNGSVITRGLGKFSRLLTRGFGGFFKKQSYKKPKEYKIDYSFDLYNPITFNVYLEKSAFVPIIFKLKKEIKLRNKLLKEILMNKKISNNLIFNIEKEYFINSKIDNSKLINILKLLE